MEKYILDTNVYIAAHMGYYNSDIAPSYWDVLKDLGKDSLIQSPKQVRDEIKRMNKPNPDKNEDNFLYDWSRDKDNKCFLSADISGIVEFFNLVVKKYTEIKKNHFEIIKKKYSDYNPSRDEPVSDSDMFVIATVLLYKKLLPNQEIILVTKENRKIHPLKSVRIPHICEAFNIKCLDDFEFIKKVGIIFSVNLIRKPNT